MDTTCLVHAKWQVEKDCTCSPEIKWVRRKMLQESLEKIATTNKKEEV